MQKPLVSISVPTFNRSGSLPRAVRSAMKQTYENIEIVISDNASPDATPEVCESLRREDPRIRYVRQATNLGATGNFLAALGLARGEYHCWLSDDDEWASEGLVEACMGAHAADRGLALASPVVKFYKGGEFLFESPRVNRLEHDPVERVLRYYAEVGDNSVFHGIARTEHWRAVPFGKFLGADWCVLASLAWMGKIRTVESAFMVRTFGWSDEYVRRYVRNHRLPVWHAFLPKGAIAVNAIADIAYRSSAFEALSAVERAALMARTARVFTSRFARADLHEALREARRQVAERGA